MDNLKEKALILHSQGYNCAQAVCAVFAEKIGLDEDMLFRLSEGFGAGTVASLDAVSGLAQLARACPCGPQDAIALLCCCDSAARLGSAEQMAEKKPSSLAISQ